MNKFDYTILFIFCIQKYTTKQLKVIASRKKIFVKHVIDNELSPYYTKISEKLLFKKYHIRK